MKQISLIFPPFFAIFMVIKYQRSALHTDILTLYISQLCQESKICTVNQEFFFVFSFIRLSQYFINMLAANIEKNPSAQTGLTNDAEL